MAADCNYGQISHLYCSRGWASMRGSSGTWGRSVCTSGFSGSRPCWSPSTICTHRHPINANFAHTTQTQDSFGFTREFFWLLEDVFLRRQKNSVHRMVMWQVQAGADLVKGEGPDGAQGVLEGAPLLPQDLQDDHMLLLCLPLRQGCGYARPRLQYAEGLV